MTSTSSAGDVVGRPLTADSDLVRAYTERTPGSATSFEAARRVLPGGETRAVTSYPPYPVIITEGHGARLTDADGHVYLDLVNNYTAMVHGSAFGRPSRRSRTCCRRGSRSPARTPTRWPWPS